MEEVSLQNSKVWTLTFLNPKGSGRVTMLLCHIRSLLEEWTIIFHHVSSLFPFGTKGLLAVF